MAEGGMTSFAVGIVIMVIVLLVIIMFIYFYWGRGVEDFAKLSKLASDLIDSIIPG